MASQLDKSAILRIGAVVSSSFRAAVGGVSGATKRLQDEIKGLRKNELELAGSLREAEEAARDFGLRGSEAVATLERKHRDVSGRVRAVSAELGRAQRAAVRLGKEGSAEIDHLLKESQRLEREERAVAHELHAARVEAGRLGVDGSKDVSKLRHEHEALERTLEREEKRLARLKAFSKLDVGSRIWSSFKDAGQNVASVSGALLSGAAKVGGAAMNSALVLGTAATAAVGLFTASAIESKAHMEDLNTALVTLEGSEQGAKNSLDWITEFSDKTPYTLEQVGEAFRKLRGAGIDPTDGALRTLGDTAASMGKDVMQAVEAMNDAVVGETERLKEFGIRSSTKGNTLTFFYKDQQNKTAKTSVDKTNQEAIQQTLLGIMNAKFSGAMEKASHTWNGLMSTLSSKWTQFQVKVMESGVFDRLKNSLIGLLGNINKWASDGTLNEWASDIGKAYDKAFDAVEGGFRWVIAHWPEIKKTVGELWERAKAALPVLVEQGQKIWTLGERIVSAAGGVGNLVNGLLVLGGAVVLSPLLKLVKVGWDVGGWLINANRETQFLSRSMSGLGSTITGLGPQLQTLNTTFSPALWVGFAAAAGYAGYQIGGLLDSWIGKALELRDGLVSTEAALKAAESDTFNSLVENVGNFLGLDTLAEAARGNRKRNEVERAMGASTKTYGGPSPVTVQSKPVESPSLTFAAFQKAQAKSRTPDLLNQTGLERAARDAQARANMAEHLRSTNDRRSPPTVNDHRVFNIRVDGARDDADELARKVTERLKNEMRREALASHG